MKKLMLAGVAVAALSLPAMAAGQESQQPSTGQQSQMSQPSGSMSQDSSTGSMSQDSSMSQGNSASQGQMQQGGQQAANETISPESLDKQQIRELQQALNKKGFDANDVDGVWGPETKDALRSFQKAQNIQSNGELDQQTLDALGVDFAQATGSQEQSGTVGAAPQSGMGGQSDLNKTNNMDQTGQSGQTGESYGGQTDQSK